MRQSEIEQWKYNRLETAVRCLTFSYEEIEEILDDIDGDVRINMEKAMWGVSEICGKKEVEFYTLTDMLEILKERIIPETKEESEEEE